MSERRYVEPKVRKPDVWSSEAVEYVLDRIELGNAIKRYVSDGSIRQCGTACGSASDFDIEEAMRSHFPRLKDEKIRRQTRILREKGLLREVPKSEHYHIHMDEDGSRNKVKVHRRSRIIPRV